RSRACPQRANHPVRKLISWPTTVVLTSLDAAACVEVVAVDVPFAGEGTSPGFAPITGFGIPVVAFFVPILLNDLIPAGGVDTHIVDADSSSSARRPSGRALAPSAGTTISTVGDRAIHDQRASDQPRQTEKTDPKRTLNKSHPSPRVGR